MGLCSATTDFTCCMKPEVSRLSTELHEAGACILSGRGLVQQAGWSCTFWLFSPCCFAVMSAYALFYAGNVLAALRKLSIYM